LNRLLATRYGEGAFADGLRGVTLVARGPKPVAALREMGLKADVVAPEPNTWRELLQAVEGRPERRIAVQEYGRRNPALLAGLEASGAAVASVRVYQYALPEDTATVAGSGAAPCGGRNCRLAVHHGGADRTPGARGGGRGLGAGRARWVA
jgi:uroporphyrinogen-III synthase